MKDRERLFEQVRKRVVAAILAGDHSVGALLPTAEALASRANCSVGTVRRALTELAREGILRRVQHKGTIVLRRPYRARVCLVLSEDRDTNSLLQPPLYSHLIAHGYSVDIVPTELNAMDHTIMRCRELRSSGSDCLLMIDPKPNFMSELERVEYAEMTALFPWRLHWAPGTTPVYPGTHLVTIDHQHSAADVMKHLLDLGHRRIGTLTPRDQSWVTDVAEHCRHLLRVVGAEFVEHYGNQNNLFTLIKERTITAYWAVNDHYAIVQMNRLREAHIAVPRDLSVVGRFATPWGTDSVPPLTTLSIDPETTARVLVDKLDDILKSDDPPALPAITRVRPRLVVRNSTGPAPQT
jgi:DNA-binding LacI/PurR family transcriptional regulator